MQLDTIEIEDKNNSVELIEKTVFSKMMEEHEDLNKQNYQGKIINMGKPSMIEIVKIAYKNTLSNGIVLFSPSAASFDMFDNYKDRGNQFKDCVNKLKS